jgi:hypothetical protein
VANECVPTVMLFLFVLVGDHEVMAHGFKSRQHTFIEM